MAEYTPPYIKPSKRGSLLKIARKEAGVNKSGQIKKEWARKKMNAPQTSDAVKKKLNFYLNFNK